MTVTRSAATSAPFSLPSYSTCRGSTVINGSASSFPAAQVSGMEVMRHASIFLRSPPLLPAADGTASSYALIVLNQRLPRFAPDLWSHAARLRIFADGGANRVYDGMPKFFPEQDPLEVRRRFWFLDEFFLNLVRDDV
ncbi:hypothetical protein BHE74_00046244 [Ensete ventricosum]|nr:hypothetical protein BHE74_00046244 [Ensete ventricosum]